MNSTIVDQTEPVNKKTKLCCAQCNTKVTIMNSLTCKCDKLFCMKHRLFNQHNCSYDYVTEDKKILQINNPKIVGDKLIKI